MSQNISIITPTFNSEKTIRRTIESILLQISPPNEYIVIDNISSDSTISIVKSYTDLFNSIKINLIIIIERDNGIYDAINKGIKLSNSEWIGIVNSDDFLEDSALINFDILSQQKEHTVLHGNIYMFSDLSKKILHKPLNNLSNSMFLFHPSMLTTKKTYEFVGLYNTNYSLSADFDWILRARNKGVSFIYVNKAMSNYYLDGISKRNVFNGIIQNYKIRENNNITFFIRVYYFMKELFFGAIKSYFIK
jgi:glycosyltransferase involved in cell wall biosynthesis